MRRLVVGGVSAVTAGGVGLVGLAPSASATSAFSSATFTRLSGPNRYATAAAIAEETFPSGANTVLLATGTNFPDALAGSYLAGTENGGAGAPILLTDPNTLSPETIAALATLKATNVIILGGTSAVSAAVQTTLAGITSTNVAGGHLTVTRISGTGSAANRLGTMQAIVAAAANPIGTNAAGQNTAILATSTNFPDALAAGALAFAKHFPLILTDGTASTLSTEAVNALTAANIKHVIVVGGSLAINPAQITQLATVNGGISVENPSGPDRGATAAALAHLEVSGYGFTNTHMNVANGFDPQVAANGAIPLGFTPDALAGSPHSGKEKAPTLIDDSPTSGASTIAFAASEAATLSSGHIFGGSLAVSDALVNAIIAAAQTGSVAAVPTTGAVSGLTPTTGPAGTVVGGTLTNPSGVTTLTVTGCGIVTPQAVVVNPTTGAFSFTIPANQAAGACTLTFLATGPNGLSVTTTLPFTVTAPALPTGLGTPPSTSAPDLVSARIIADNFDTSGTSTVQFVFDKTLTAAPVPGDYGLEGYAVGHRAYAFHVALDPTNPDAVDATYTNAVNPASYTIAAVDSGGATGASGLNNPLGAVPLQGTSPVTAGGHAAGLTSSPMLISAAPTLGFTNDATFTFDQPIPTGNSNDFFFYDGAGVAHQATGVVNVGTNNVTVHFAAPVATATRFAVTFGGAVSSAGRPSPDGAVNNGSAVAPNPNLTTVFQVANTPNAYRFTFDKACGSPLNPGDFFVYDSNGFRFTANAAVQISGDTVQATFPGVNSSNAGDIVLGSVEQGACKDAATGLLNSIGDAAVSGSTGANMGLTSGPTLLSATADRLGNTVTYTFNQPISLTVNSHSFFVLDPSGDAPSYGIFGSASINGDSVTVRFAPGAVQNAVGAGVANDFFNEKAANTAAVLGVLPFVENAPGDVTLS